MVVTFVTSSNMRKCVHILDDLRLNKQRVEACQILKAIDGTGGYSNHPAVLMWVGYKKALKLYINACISEWRKRGKYCELEPYEIDKNTVTYPWWFTWKELHLSHKCSLLRKNPNYYKNHFKLTKEEKPWLELGYIWPSDLSEDLSRRIIRHVNRNGSSSKVVSPTDICRSIGAGAPAQYRWSLEQVKEWSKDKSINPKTGKKIKTTAKTGVYVDINKAYQYYLEQGLLNDTESTSSENSE